MIRGVGLIRLPLTRVGIRGNVRAAYPDTGRRQHLGGVHQRHGDVPGCDQQGHLGAAADHDLCAGLDQTGGQTAHQALRPRANIARLDLKHCLQKRAPPGGVQSHGLDPERLQRRGIEGITAGRGQNPDPFHPPERGLGCRLGHHVNEGQAAGPDGIGMGVSRVARHGQHLGPRIAQPRRHLTQHPLRPRLVAVAIGHLRVHIHQYADVILVAGRGRQRLQPRQKGDRRRRPHTAQNPQHFHPSLPLAYSPAPTTLS